MKAIIAAVAFVALLVIGGIASYVTNANYGNRAEVNIDKEYENLQNILSQYSLKISEAAQVPQAYKADLKDVLTSVMTARMGKDGSKAMFQWFKEQDINLDPSIYKKIQNMIESGRNQYQNSQTRFIDIKATYVADLGYVWKGMWLGFAGYPKINVGYPRGTVDDYPIIKSTYAINAFETGVDKGMTIFK